MPLTLALHPDGADHSAVLFNHLLLLVLSKLEGPKKRQVYKSSYTSALLINLHTVVSTILPSLFVHTQWYTGKGHHLLQPPGT